MREGVIHALSAMPFGPGVCEVVTEMSAIIRLGSFWGAMSPQHLFFKALDGVPGCSVGHRMCFQPPGGCLHPCEHMALALAGLWQCDTISLPGLSTFIFQPS